MKTDAWIDVLARGAGAAPRHVATRRLLPAGLLALLVSTLLILWLLGPIPMAMASTPAPWIKAGYALALMLATGWWAVRLGRPAASTRGAGQSTLAVIALMLAIGIGAGLDMPAEARPAGLWGHSWSTCPAWVLLLSLPAQACLFWGLRSLAPVRPALAGLAVGLCAGALGSLAYALACTETSTLFISIWYTLGIGLAGALGAWLGPKMLRW